MLSCKLQINNYIDLLDNNSSFQPNKWNESCKQNYYDNIGEKEIALVLKELHENSNIDQIKLDRIVDSLSKTYI